MSKEQCGIAFSKLIELTQLNVANLPGNPSLYMICKKDNTNNNQVIFAGVASNLKTELNQHLETNLSSDNLYFCYIPTSVKNVLKNSNKPLYQRVA